MRPLAARTGPALATASASVRPAARPVQRGVRPMPCPLEGSLSDEEMADELRLVSEIAAVETVAVVEADVAEQRNFEADAHTPPQLEVEGADLPEPIPW